MSNILILQKNKLIQTRTFKYFKHIDEVNDFLIEEFIKFSKSISNEEDERQNIFLFEISDYLTFIYSLHDIAILLYEEDSKNYTSYGKDFICLHFLDYIQKLKNGR